MRTAAPGIPFDDGPYPRRMRGRALAIVLTLAACAPAAHLSGTELDGAAAARRGVVRVWHRRIQRRRRDGGGVAQRCDLHPRRKGTRARARALGHRPEGPRRRPARAAARGYVRKRPSPLLYVHRRGFV